MKQNRTNIPFASLIIIPQKDEKVKKNVDKNINELYNKNEQGAIR